MNQEYVKLLRRGAKKYNLDYKSLKAEFEKLSDEEKKEFIKQAKLTLRYVN